MKHLRIMTVCGFGLGTSLVLRMTLDDVLDHHGLQAETFCADADTASSQHFDLVVTSKEMSGRFEDIGVPVIVIDDFMSAGEVSEKVIPVIRELQGI